MNEKLTGAGEVPGLNDDLHLALWTALKALHSVIEAATPRLSYEKQVALADHLAAGHVVTLVVNRTSDSKVEAALALTGPGPFETKVLFKLESPLADPLAPAWAMH